jgi:hypothetical protein
MPAHKLPLTFADAVSLLTCFLFLYQPGVNRQAVMQWIIDNIFGGSVEKTNRWAMFSLHKVFEWTFLAGFGIIYWLALPCIEKYKVLPQVPWSWNDPRPEVREKGLALRSTAIKYIVKFHVCVFFVTYLLPGAVLDLDLVRAETVPVWWVTAYQVLLGIAIAETGFYWGHRMIHASPWLYSFHKQVRCFFCFA